MGAILTTDEVRKALYLDDDYDAAELDRLSKTASSFLYEKTGYDFSKVSDGEEREPLAIQCAVLYVRDLFFQGNGYNKEHDYNLGINSLIVDLQTIASRKKEVTV
jgi:hypothetical protein